MVTIIYSIIKGAAKKLAESIPYPMRTYTKDRLVKCRDLLRHRCEIG